MLNRGLLSTLCRRGPKGRKNIKISHSGSKAQSQGDTRNHGLRGSYVSMSYTIHTIPHTIDSIPTTKYHITMCGLWGPYYEMGDLSFHAFGRSRPGVQGHRRVPLCAGGGGSRPLNLGPNLLFSILYKLGGGVLSRAEAR